VTDALQGSNGLVPDQHAHGEADRPAGDQASEQNVHADEDSDDESVAGPDEHDQFMAGLLAQGLTHEEVASAAGVSVPLGTRIAAISTRNPRPRRCYVRRNGSIGSAS
jgi:hypothetical protein